MISNPLVMERSTVQSCPAAPVSSMKTTKQSETKSAKVDESVRTEPKRFTYTRGKYVEETAEQRTARLYRVKVLDLPETGYESWLPGHFKALMRIKRGRAEQPIHADITPDLLYDIAYRQRFKCAVSGIPFSGPTIFRGKRAPFAPSIDRIDNAIGYEPDNIRIVCLIVNFGLNEFGDEVFLEMCRAVARHNV